MTKRTIAMLALTFTLTLSGAGSAEAATPLAPLSLRTARFIITNHAGGPMQYISGLIQPGDSWREAPGDIAGDATGDYTLTSSNRDVGAALDYYLPVGDYQLHIYGDNWLLLPNEWGCSVSLRGRDAPKPYTCTVRQDKKGYNDTNFSVTVSRDDGVASRRQATR